MEKIKRHTCVTFVDMNRVLYRFAGASFNDAARYEQSFVNYRILTVSLRGCYKKMALSQVINDVTFSQLPRN